MSEHTPGPWSAVFWYGDWSIDTPEGESSPKHIGVFVPESTSDAEMEANAHLIAAAPEVLAALKLLAHDCRPQHVEVAYAAIAKAEGSA